MALGQLFGSVLRCHATNRVVLQHRFLKSMATVEEPWGFTFTPHNSKASSSFFTLSPTAWIHAADGKYIPDWKKKKKKGDLWTCVTNIATNFCTRSIYGFLCCSRYSVELSEYPVTNLIINFPMERLFKSLSDISLFFIYFSHLHFHLRTVRALWERFFKYSLKSHYFLLE